MSLGVASAPPCSYPGPGLPGDHTQTDGQLDRLMVGTSSLCFLHSPVCLRSIPVAVSRASSLLFMARKACTGQAMHHTLLSHSLRSGDIQAL